jgi:hypothetical protein
MRNDPLKIEIEYHQLHTLEDHRYCGESVFPHWYACVSNREVFFSREGFEKEQTARAWARRIAREVRQRMERQAAAAAATDETKRE